LFCPKCKAEYRPGFTTCADCDIDLVDHLPDAKPKARFSEDYRPRNPASPDLVTVFESRDHGRVAFAKSLLQSADIPFFARGDELVASYDGVLGPVELQVASDQAEDAKELLSDLTPAE
jgi:hypothetical protein